MFAALAIICILTAGIAAWLVHNAKDAQSDSRQPVRVQARRTERTRR